MTDKILPLEDEHAEHPIATDWRPIFKLNRASQNLKNGWPWLEKSNDSAALR